MALGQGPLARSSTQPPGTANFTITPRQYSREWPATPFGISVGLRSSRRRKDPFRRRDDPYADERGLLYFLYLEDYREWLVTLPHFPGTCFSENFNVRNILAHVRWDIRDGAADEKGLMLHAVQSDWLQESRCRGQTTEYSEYLPMESPFYRNRPHSRLN